MARLKLDRTKDSVQWLRIVGKLLKKKKKKAKSPTRIPIVRKSIETLRDELQKLFPEQKVVIR